MLREREQMTDDENGFAMIGNAWIGVTKVVQVNLRRTRRVSNVDQKKISSYREVEDFYLVRKICNRV